jgi:hypothetical protein
MNWISKLLAIVLTLTLTSVVFAQTHCQGEQCFEQICHGNQCRNIVKTEAAMQTLQDLRSASAHDQELSPALLGAIATGVGVAGAASYATYANYRQNMEIAQKTAVMMKEQGRVLARAMESVVAPELQRFTQALIQKNTANAAKGVAALTAQESEQLILRGMQSPSVKQRIIEGLTRALGNSSAKPIAKEMAELAYHNLIRDSRGMISRQWNNVIRLSAQGILQSARLGSTLMAPITEKILPFLTKSSTQRILAHLSSSAGRGLLASCAGWIKSIFKPRIAAGIGGGALTAAFILLDASPLAAGTLDDLYTHNPALLLTMPEEQARHWITQYPSVRTALYSLGEMVLQNGYSKSEESLVCEFQEVEQEINECRLGEES